MKAISVNPAMAYAILHGKDVENRSWSTSYRGLVLIHATGKCSAAQYAAAKTYCAKRGVVLPPRKQLPTGCVVGVTRIVRVVKPRGFCDSVWFNWRGHGLMLRDTRALRRPVPASGQVRLWTPSAELVRAVQQR